MADGRDDSEKRLEKLDTDEDRALSDGASPLASPRDKKTRLTTREGDISVPGSSSRGRRPVVQDLLVAGRSMIRGTLARVPSRRTLSASQVLSTSPVSSPLIYTDRKMAEVNMQELLIN